MRSVPSGSYFGRGLDLYLQGATDRFIVKLEESALKNRVTGVVIAGEQWQLCRLAMYVLGPAVALVLTRARQILVSRSRVGIN